METTNGRANSTVVKEQIVIKLLREFYGFFALIRYSPASYRHTRALALTHTRALMFTEASVSTNGGGGGGIIISDNDHMLPCTNSRSTERRR